MILLMHWIFYTGIQKDAARFFFFFFFFCLVVREARTIYLSLTPDIFSFLFFFFFGFEKEISTSYCSYAWSAQSGPMR